MVELYLEVLQLQQVKVIMVVAEAVEHLTDKVAAEVLALQEVRLLAVTVVLGVSSLLTLATPTVAQTVQLSLLHIQEERSLNLLLL